MYILYRNTIFEGKIVIYKIVKKKHTCSVSLGFFLYETVFKSKMPKKIINKYVKFYKKNKQLKIWVILYVQEVMTLVITTYFIKWVTTSWTNGYIIN